jgi:hypothetical protein
VILMRFFNCDYRRVGGLRFLKLGRLTVSWSVSRVYRPIGSRARAVRAVRSNRALWADPVGEIDAGLRRAMRGGIAA